MTNAIWQRNIVDGSGAILPGATVAVFDTGGGSLVTLYDGDDVAITNPVVADANGYAFFYAPPGKYYLKVAFGTSTTPYPDVLVGTTADDGVSTLKILDANVTEAKIATGAVTEDKIGAAAVTTAKIADAAVTSDKVDSSVATSADLVGFSGGTTVYADTTAGLAGTTVGDYFNVPSGESDELLILYRHDSGPTATEIGRSPSADLLDEIVRNSYMSDDYVALFVDDDGNVPIWLEDGNLGATGLTQELKTNVNEDVITRTDLVIADDYVPLFKDDDGNVPVWLEDGKLNASDVHQDLKDLLLDNVNTPLATDGRSLYRAKAKIARLQVGGSLTKLKIAMTGDSWTDFTTIPDEFLAALDALYGTTATGWVSLGAGNTMSPVSVSYTGFTLLDEVANARGPDMYAIQATGTTETAQVSSLTAEDVDIYYEDTDGTFRYRVDGGSWNTVAGTSSGDVLKVALTGLSDTAHTIDFDTTGNTGTVRLIGLYSSRAASGVEVSKIGNGGAKASDYESYASNFADFYPDIDPDVVFIILGTNDGAAGVPPATFKTQMESMVAAMASAVPQAAIVLVAPPHSSGTAESDLSGYRDAMYEIAAANAMVEFLNAHDMVANYSTMNDADFDIWLNANHLNSAGGRLIYSAAAKHILMTE